MEYFVALSTVLNETGVCGCGVRHFLIYTLGFSTLRKFTVTRLCT